MRRPDGVLEDLQLVDPGLVPRVRSHCRFTQRGTEYDCKYGTKWVTSSAKRQCDRALLAPVGVGAVIGLVADAVVGRRDQQGVLPVRVPGRATRT